MQIYNTPCHCWGEVSFMNKGNQICKSDTSEDTLYIFVDSCPTLCMSTTELRFAHFNYSFFFFLGFVDQNREVQGICIVSMKQQPPPFFFPF